MFERGRGTNSYRLEHLPSHFRSRCHSERSESASAVEESRGSTERLSLMLPRDSSTPFQALHSFHSAQNDTRLSGKVFWPALTDKCGRGAARFEQLKLARLASRSRTHPFIENTDAAHVICASATHPEQVRLNGEAVATEAKKRSAFTSIR